MRRIASLLAFTVTATLVATGSATAASQTVKGTGDIKKMKVVNAKRALKVSLFGLGAPCDGAQYMRVTVDWGTRAGYEIDNGCYPGGTWAKSLVYLSDRSDSGSGKIVKCPKLRFGFDEATESHRAKVPRSCIPKAGNRLRVSAFGNNYASATGGEAGPTRRLKRG